MQRGDGMTGSIMRWLLIAPLLAATLISTCPARAAKSSIDIPFTVVTTTSHVADLVRTVAGDRASTVVLPLPLDFLAALGNRGGANPPG